MDATERMMAQILSHEPFVNPNPLGYHFFNEFMESDCDHTIGYGGNRIGKSETGAFKGSTYLVGIDPTHPARIIPPRAKIWVITDAGNVQVIFEKIDRFLPPGIITKRRESKGDWYLETVFGSRLWVKTHDQERRKFQSEDLDLVWWDEEPLSQDIYGEVEKRLTDRDGKQIWTYTPRVGGVWLKKMFGGLKPKDRAAKTGRLSWTSAGLIHNPYIPIEHRLKAIEKAKITHRHQPDVYRVTIEGSYEVFEGEEVFPDDALEDIFDPKEGKRGFIEDTHEQDLTKRYRFVDLKTGPLVVYERPIAGYQYALGCDASNNSGGDAACIEVLNRNTMAIVAEYHMDCDAYELGTRAYELGYYYNIALVNPEANPPGNATINSLRHKSYPKICRRRDTTGKFVENLNAFGALTGPASKKLWVQSVSAVVKDRELFIHSQELRDEMENFRKVDDRNKDVPTKHYGYAAIEGHDDRVMALIHAVIAHINNPLNLINKGYNVPDKVSPDRQKVIDVMESFSFEGKKFSKEVLHECRKR